MYIIYRYIRAHSSMYINTYIHIVSIQIGQLRVSLEVTAQKMSTKAKLNTSPFVYIQADVYVYFLYT